MKHVLFVFALILGACSPCVKSSHVWVSSAAGDKCADKQQVRFYKGAIQGAVIINPEDKRQTIDGFGNSITESSAYVLACLPPDQRHAIIAEMYGENGANFSASRTVVGASDFTVEGNYSFDDVPDDYMLTHFSMAVHQDGWSKAQYPDIKDEHFDVWQFMNEIHAVKLAQQDSVWNLVASPWTAPAWMKDNNMFYDKANRYGGSLMSKYFGAFSRYYVKFLQAYKDAGIRFWAITPENEPMGNDGSWESMHLAPQAEAVLIGQHLAPQLHENGFGDVKILCFDQNTFEAAPYTAAVFGDSLANLYTDGVALHWYGSTVSCFPDVLDSLHAAHPDKRLIHTEGCIDNLGRDGWPGVSDYAGYKESGWFLNDDFWWTPSATDWAYSTPWWPEWHPKYTPVHRYASYIIDGLNHWLTGFIDWNCVLDSVGGPTHVNNNCGAEIMVDYVNGQIYYTPYYYVLKQFSRSMRPGDVVLGVTEPPLPQLHVCAVAKQDGSYAINILNTGKALAFPLQIGDYIANIEMPENSLKTIIISL